MFSIAFFLNARSGFLLLRLKTRLNGVKSIVFEQSQKFYSMFLVRKESISGRSSETLWELRSIPSFFRNTKKDRGGTSDHFTVTFGH
jgi:hypothetical protein